MSVRFRKSKKIGPLRVTLSKSGVSTSIGTKGARVTRRADGRVQTTASIPGTGVSYTKVHRKTSQVSQANHQPEKRAFLDTASGKLITLSIIVGIVIGLFVLIDIFFAG